MPLNKETKPNQIAYYDVAVKHFNIGSRGISSAFCKIC